MSDSRPLLADIWTEDTYKSVKIFHKAPSRTRAEFDKALMKYRIMLRRANRFELDDQLTEYISEVAGRTTIPAMLRRIPAAVLPYETTWLEFSLHTKVATSIRLGLTKHGSLDRVPERMGLLIQRDINSPSAWSMSVVTSDANDLPSLRSSIIPIVYLFDAAGIDATATHIGGYAMWPAEGLNGRPISREMRATPWGFIDPDGVHNAPPELMSKSQLSVAHDALFFFKTLHDDEKAVAKYMTLVARAMFEHAGLLRWALTALGVLSEVPTYRGYIEPTGRRLVGTTHRQYMDYHRVSIKLPKRAVPIPYIERRLDNSEARRRRQHEVRAFWRTYLTDDRARRCEHRWEYSDDVQTRICTACRSRGSRVREHMRGDPSLGFVRKDYVLEKR